MIRCGWSESDVVRWETHTRRMERQRKEAIVMVGVGCMLWVVVECWWPMGITAAVNSNIEEEEEATADDDDEIDEPPSGKASLPSYYSVFRSCCPSF